MRRATWPMLMAALLATACGAEPNTTQPVVADVAEATSVASEPPAADLSAPSPVVDAAPVDGPINGLWRCKMNGDIPLGTLSFNGGAYTFQTTNTAWEPNPNSSDGSGTVRFEENFILPVDGPLKTSFEVTGAFGDGSFINFNTNLGLLFGCRRP